MCWLEDNIAANIKTKTMCLIMMIWQVYWDLHIEKYWVWIDYNLKEYCVWIDLNLKKLY